MRRTNNSKLQHSPRAIELLKIGLFKFPPPGARIVFKCPIQFLLQNAKSATVTFYPLIKLQNLTLKTFSSEPFARESEIFTLNTSILKDIILVIHWKDLKLTV